MGQFTSWFSDRLNRVPPASDSIQNRERRYAASGGPLSYRERFSFIGNYVVVAAVVLLGLLIAPLAVLLGVIPVVFYAINSVFGRRLMAHVRNKAPEIGPFIANLNSPSSVSRPLCTPRIIASVVDVLPRLVQWVGTWSLSAKPIGAIHNFSHSESFSLSVSTIPQQRTAA